MSADPAAQARYRRALSRNGQQVRFARPSGVAPNVVLIPPGGATVTARVMDYLPDGVAASESGYSSSALGGITQGERRIIVMADDLSGAGFPLPAQKGDLTTLLDDAGAEIETLLVTRVDASKRALAGAIELSATGVA